MKRNSRPKRIEKQGKERERQRNQTKARFSDFTGPARSARRRLKPRRAPASRRRGLARVLQVRDAGAEHISDPAHGADRGGRPGSKSIFCAAARQGCRSSGRIAPAAPAQSREQRPARQRLAGLADERHEKFVFGRGEIDPPPDRIGEVARRGVERPPGEGIAALIRRGRGRRRGGQRSRPPPNARRSQSPPDPGSRRRQRKFAWIAPSPYGRTPTAIRLNGSKSSHTIA